MSCRERIAAIERGDGALSSHRDHLALAWCYLSTYPFEEAAPRCAHALRRFAASRGAPERYHATVTWAFLALVAERLEAPGARSRLRRFRRHEPRPLRRAAPRSPLRPASRRPHRPANLHLALNPRSVVPDRPPGGLALNQAFSHQQSAFSSNASRSWHDHRVGEITFRVIRQVAPSGRTCSADG